MSGTTDAFLAFNERRAGVVALLTKLQSHAAELGTPSLADRIQSELVEKLEQDRFDLVVVGEFNHGKTTFVNALLAHPWEDAQPGVLPVGVTPTTALIHRIEHADEATAELVSTDGTARTIELDGLADFVVTSDHCAEDDTVDSSTPVRIDVGYPAELLRDRIVLVDTPGVNDLCLQRADITYEYIPRADAILFVLDAGQPLKESERLFLRDKLIGQSRDKIVFVVAKADIWSDDERAEGLSYIKEELGKLADAPAVFAVSPERALKGEVVASGMRELVDHLSAFLAEERGRIMLDNALGEGLSAARTIARGIDARRRAAHMSRDEIARRIARIESDLEGQQRTIGARRGAIREEIAAIRAWAGRDVERFCDDVTRQLPNLVEQVPVAELKRNLAGFLEATLVDWAERETAEIAQALEALAETTVALMRDDAHETAQRLSGDVRRDVTAPDVSIDTLGYDLGVAALFTVGVGVVFSNALLGLLMAGAAPILAYYLKGRVESETRAKAVAQATRALREVADTVAPKLDEMIDNFGEKLDAWVQNAGKEVHRQLLDILNVAQEELNERGPDVERIEAQCANWHESLDAARAEIEQRRAALWTRSKAVELVD